MLIRFNKGEKDSDEDTLSNQSTETETRSDTTENQDLTFSLSWEAPKEKKKKNPHHPLHHPEKKDTRFEIGGWKELASALPFVKPPAPPPPVSEIVTPQSVVVVVPPPPSEPAVVPQLPQKQIKEHDIEEEIKNIHQQHLHKPRAESSIPLNVDLEKTRYTKMIRNWIEIGSALELQKKLLVVLPENTSSKKLENHWNQLEQYLDQSWRIQLLFQSTLFHNIGEKCLHCWLNAQLQLFTMWHRAIFEFCMSTFISQIEKSGIDWFDWDSKRWYRKWLNQFNSAESMWQILNKSHAIDSCMECQKSENAKLCADWPCLPNVKIEIL